MNKYASSVEFGCMCRRQYLAEARLQYRHASIQLAFIRKHEGKHFYTTAKHAEGAVLAALDKVWQLQCLVEADDMAAWVNGSTKHYIDHVA